ncbi:MAG: protein translocase subunit SecD [Gemmatimonadales bacterium]
MLSTLRARLVVIGLLVLCSLLVLWNNYRLTATHDRPGQPVSLGLDLQGGMHLALELDQSAQRSDDPSRDTDLALAILRKRIDEFGVTERLIQKVGDHRIVVELPGVRDPERAREIVRRNAFLEFRLTDQGDAFAKALPAIDRVIGPVAGATRGGTGAVSQLLGKGVEPATAAGTFSSLLTPSRITGEFLVEQRAWRTVDSLLQRDGVRRLWPRGVEVKWAADSVGSGREWYRALYALEDRAVVTGASLVDAQAQIDPMTNAPEVTFRLDNAGGRRFALATERNIGNHLAILLDGRVQGAPPVIQNRIDRSGRIEMGGRSLTEAQDLALTLRAGALPIPLRIVEERQVGPSLGADSIQGGITAGLVGTALVVLIMVGYYGLSGLLAVGVLTLYTLFTLGGLTFVGAALTLPGLAGFILSIGFAVDANVLIFERIREELAAGKSVRSAVHEGFRHAMPAIIDSNITTVLTALFLFRFGTGPVKGFAVTLVIGILASMVTAVFVTRTCYQLWLRWKPEMKTISLGRVRLFQHAAYDFIRHQRTAVGLTLVLLLAGIVGMAARGVNYSVEFTGGTLIQVQTARAIDVGELRGALREAGDHSAEIQRFGADNQFVIRTAAEGADDGATAQPEARVRTALDQVSGPGAYRIERVEAVGPKVGGELRQQAFAAIGLSFLAVLAYLAWRFEWRFGVAAVVATAHDIAATLAFIALMRLEVGLVVVAALLTVVGYSLNDTIVIFDRVREQLREKGRKGYVALLNSAINETLPRTILTGGTALATLLALAIFGGEVIRPFALVMFFGIFTGTFSSVFIAAPVLLWIERRWPSAAAAAPPALAPQPAARP